MAKRGMLFVYFAFALSFLAPNAFSAGELIYSETVEDLDFIEIAGKEFQFRIDKSGLVAIEIDTSGLIVNSGECEARDKLEICIKNVNLSYRNYTAYYDVYKADVEVYQLKSEIKVTNTILNPKLLIDEETVAELSFENIGDIPADNVTAYIKVPSSLSILDLEKCKKAFDGVLFISTVHPEQMKTCKYGISGIKAGDFELEANVSYFNGVKNINSTSAATGRVYNYSLKLTAKIDKTKFDIGERFNFTLDVENTNDQYDLTITNLGFRIPQNLALLKKPIALVGNDRVLSWSGILKPKEIQSFLFQFQGLISGNYTLEINENYKISKFLRQMAKNFEFEVGCDCPYIQHEFFNEISAPGQSALLRAYLFNPSKFNTFNNARAAYKTDIPGINNYSKSHTSLKPGELISIFDSSVVSPSLLGDLYYLDVSAVYESQAKQVFTAADNILIGIPKEEKKLQEAQQEKSSEITAREQEGTVEKDETGQDVSLGQEPETKEEIKEESKEKNKEKANEEVILSAEDEKKTISAIAVISFILGLILISVFVVRLKNRKESLSGAKFKKELDQRKSQQQLKNRIEYEDLARQVREIGMDLQKKEERKKGFLARIFRRK